MTEKMMKFLAEAEKDAAFAEKVNTVESLDAPWLDGIADMLEKL